MKNSKILLPVFSVIGLLMSSAILQSAQAQAVSIKNVSCLAAGCLGAQVVAAPDNSAISVLFNQFSVELGASNANKPVDQKIAQLDFTVVVPAGYQMEFISLDLRGFAAVGSRTVGSIESRQLMLGRKLRLPESATTKTFTADSISDFSYSDLAYARSRSECGDEVRIKTMTKLLLDARHRGPRDPIASSNIMMDSTDISNPSLKFKVSLKRCN